MNIKDLVKDTKVRFLYYQKGELWYEVIKEAETYSPTTYTEYDRLFVFPVPIDDTGDGRFLAEDKALIFMRYIRKYLQEQEKEKNHD
jgi:hypothetical protein